jgi:hypothetical protein
MITSTPRRGKPGFVSYLLVLSTGLILTLLMVYTYRRAMNSQKVQSSVQLRTDYGEKEDAILRSIIAITPNRAIRAMQDGSNSSTTASAPLSWQAIFTEALDLANSRTSIPTALKGSLNIADLKTGNSGDSALSDPAKIFRAISPETGYVSAGLNRSLGSGFPDPLSTSTPPPPPGIRSIRSFPRRKLHGALAQNSVALPVADYPLFNLHTYPRINFGYARPGELFVAKRNWWAFSMNAAGADAASTRLARPDRDFVLSIYEIPSQLAISASSFMSLGAYASGEAWQNVTISGGVFGGKVQVEGDTAIPALATRRGMTLSGQSTVGGQSFVNNPFTPGVREAFQVTQGEFFPVSLASESGRVAFVAINRGAEFFDRFTHSTENNVLSPTSWNNYSIGALQCAMRLDITQVKSSTNMTPTALRFSYMQGGARKNLALPLDTGVATGLPPGYIFACIEDQTYNFGNSVVDVAYGKDGVYAFQTGVTGSITFNNARFGDPLVGIRKWGYYKPSYPFEIKNLTSGKICVAVYPQRMKKFLESLNADGPEVNNSLVVNVDYSTTTGSIWLTKPTIPCTDLDYGVILQECADLTSFPKGFSLVTNLRTYIGDDFNRVEATPPAGYASTGKYYPPCSLFMPEKRYGVDEDRFEVELRGQVGSLASETNANPISPLESKGVSGNAIPSSRITVNLKPITHPAELPPITMMNWLVVLEERRKEFIGN